MMLHLHCPTNRVPVSQRIPSVLTLHERDNFRAGSRSSTTSSLVQGHYSTTTSPLRALADVTVPVVQRSFHAATFVDALFHCSGYAAAFIILCRIRSRSLRCGPSTSSRVPPGMRSDVSSLLRCVRFQHALRRLPFTSCFTSYAFSTRTN